MIIQVNDDENYLNDNHFISKEKLISRSKKMSLEGNTQHTYTHMSVRIMKLSCKFHI
jgi:hypothetical protein